MSHATAEKLSWALVAAWAALIFFESARSGASLDTGNDFVAMVKRMLADAAALAFGHEVDVSPVGHFAEYLVFGGLLLNAVRFRAGGAKAVALALGIAAVYAATDEFHQLFVPQRSCDPADWAVDVVAALLGAVIVAAFARKKGARVGNPRP